MCHVILCIVCGCIVLIVMSVIDLKFKKQMLYWSTCILIEKCSNYLLYLPFKVWFIVYGLQRHFQQYFSYIGHLKEIIWY